MELEDIVARYQKGRADDDLDMIVAALDPFIKYMCKKYYNLAGYEADDLYNEALVVLAMKAIPDYEPSKGLFTSFAKLCIQRAFVTFLKSTLANKSRALNTAMSMDQTIDDHGHGNEPMHAPLADMLIDERAPDPSAASEMTDSVAAATALLDGATELERFMFECWILHLTYDESARAWAKWTGTKRITKGMKKQVDNSLARLRAKLGVGSRMVAAKKNDSHVKARRRIAKSLGIEFKLTETERTGIWKKDNPKQYKAYLASYYLRIVKPKRQARAKQKAKDASTLQPMSQDDDPFG